MLSTSRLFRFIGAIFIFLFWSVPEVSSVHLIKSGNSARFQSGINLNSILLGDSSPTMQPTSIFSPADICLQYMNTVCGNTTHQLRFNETIACLSQNAQSIESICGSALGDIILTTLSSCQFDIPMLCWKDLTSPFAILLCLFDNYQFVSQSCRVQLNTLLSPFLPCTAEASKYCPDKTTLEDIIDCLSAVSPSQLSKKCVNALDGYEDCEDTKNADKSIPCWKKKSSATDDDSNNNGDSSGGKTDNSSTDPAVADSSGSSHPVIATMALLLIFALIYVVYRKNGSTFEGLTVSRVREIFSQEFSSWKDYCCPNHSLNVPPPQARASQNHGPAQLAPSRGKGVRGGGRGYLRAAQSEEDSDDRGSSALELSVHNPLAPSSRDDPSEEEDVQAV